MLLSFPFRSLRLRFKLKIIAFSHQDHETLSLLSFYRCGRPGSTVYRELIQNLAVASLSILPPIQLLLNFGRDRDSHKKEQVTLVLALSQPKIPAKIVIKVRP